jgi:hypothetical protein
MTSLVFALLLPADPGAIGFLCTILAAALIAYTLHVPAHLAQGAEKTRLTFLGERKETVYENLRDLNFEYKAGKLPETDYQQMRASLESEAAALLAEIERLESVSNPILLPPPLPKNGKGGGPCKGARS